MPVHKANEKMKIEPSVQLQGSIVTTKPEVTKKNSGRLMNQINLTLVMNTKSKSPVQKTNRLASLSFSLIDTQKPHKNDIDIINEVRLIIKD